MELGLKREGLVRWLGTVHAASPGVQAGVRPLTELWELLARRQRGAGLGADVD